MRGRRDADDHDRQPQPARDWREHRRDDRERGDQHRRLPRTVECPASLDQRPRLLKRAALR